MSPWTRAQIRLMLSKYSPVDEAEQAKIKRELHENPALGHAKKGSKELKKNG